jgi:hypothetical protein
MNSFPGFGFASGLSAITANRLSLRLTALFLWIACILLSMPASGAISLPGSKCPHIKVLEKRDAAQVREEYRSRIDNPSSAQIRYLTKATNLISPLLCQAVRRVVYIDLAHEPGVSGWTMANEAQDLIYLNSAKRASWNNLKIEGSPTAQAKAIQNFVHESAHAAIRLLQSQQKNVPPPGELLGVQIKHVQSRPKPSLWDKSASGLARAVIDRLSLEQGVLREWVRLHESFRTRGLAGRYYGDDWDGDNTAILNHPKNGFTSDYGGQAPIEDIAELTGWAVAGHLFTGGAQSAHRGQACEALKSHDGTGVPDGLSAVYGKLGLLRSMEFIDEQSFLRCVGRDRKVPVAIRNE